MRVAGREGMFAASGVGPSCKSGREGGVVLHELFLTIHQSLVLQLGLHVWVGLGPENRIFSFILCDKHLCLALPSRFGVVFQVPVPMM